MLEDRREGRGLVGRRALPVGRRVGVAGEGEARYGGPDRVGQARRRGGARGLRQRGQGRGVGRLAGTSSRGLRAYYENLFARMAVVELGQSAFAALYGKLDAIGKEVEELKKGRPGEGVGGER